MRSDDEIGVLAAGDGDRYGGREPAVGAAPVDDLAYGSDVDGVALEDLDERLLELDSTGGIEDLKESRRGAAEVFPSFSEDAKECPAAACGFGQSIEATVFPRTPFLG